MASNDQPLYATAVLLPVLAFPAWILTIPPLVFHYGQRNLPAISLITWLMFQNFFNSINPLIWPRDNIEEWFNGNVLCDIEVRLFIGASVGLGASIAMLFRRLAIVMDTSNITIAPSRHRRLRERVLEALWCWGYPILVIVIYYIVQPIRYYIFTISGCVSAYNLSWVSIILGAVWPPVTVCFAAYYAGLLAHRLLRYRREFHSILAARNTTKTRFMRLFILSMLCILVWMPYSFWILWLFASNLTEDFSWRYVHGPGWNSVSKVPAIGHVRVDRWGQVAFGYCIFIAFGFGADAANTYKRILRTLGFGRIFPSLYQITESGVSTPTNFSFGHKWRSTVSSRAKDIFAMRESVTATRAPSTEIPSVCGDTILLTPQNSDPAHSHPGSEPVLQHGDSTIPKKHLIGSFFARFNRKPLMLPIFTKPAVGVQTETTKSPTIESCSPSVYAHIWSSECPAATYGNNSHGNHAVLVKKEVNQTRHKMGSNIHKA